MKPWNASSNIAMENSRIVKFYFDTSDGPGYVTTFVNQGVSIDEAKSHLMMMLAGKYKTLEITKYEILEILEE